MTFKLITNPSFEQISGFSAYQFRKLDALYLQAASRKTLTYRSVECDFDEGIASYTYYASEGRPAALQFVIRRVGPKTQMYEVYKEGKGRIMKSGVFERSYERLAEEIEAYQ